MTVEIPLRTKHWPIDMIGHIPVRRKRGAVRLNCAECRRLKVRCDRTVPCSSCVKRGCSAICPDGTLTTGQGNRYVLASTEELHERNLQLAWRVRCLEDALQTLQSERSPDTHPLLSEDLLKIKIPLQKETLPSQDSISEPLDGDRRSGVGDTFASMSMPESGTSRYYGHAANSWFYLRNGSNEPEEVSEESMASKLDLPPEILGGASTISLSSFGTSSGNSDFGIDKLLPFLPAQPVTDALRTIYYTHASWIYNPVPLEQFEDQIYSVFYGSGAFPPGKSLFQKLSILFLVLAIGSLVDDSLPPYNVEAERYHQLARAALFQTSIIDAPSLHAVQALFLMSFYQFLADRHGTSSDARWALMGMAVRASQNIGLHRDGSLWGFDTVVAQNRRVLFWEIFTYDSWQSLTFGRPTSFPLAHVDCRQPYLTASIPDDEAFHAWKHHFTSNCLNTLHDRAFGARGLGYSAALQLDENIRNFPVPPILNTPGSLLAESSRSSCSTTTTLSLQRHLVVAIREISLLYLHRSFFARAICNHSEDPLGSPYANSIHAVFHSAQNLVAMIRSLHNHFRSSCERMWFLWTHIFSCSIVLASLVTRCPSINVAPSALHQLDLACRLFSDVATGFRATKMLEIMHKLQRKAQRCLKDHQGGGGTMDHNNRYSPTRYGTPSVENDCEELTMLKGNIHEEPASVSPPSYNSEFQTPLPRPAGQQDHITNENNTSSNIFTQSSASGRMAFSEVPLPSETSATAGGVAQPEAFPYPTAVLPNQTQDIPRFMDEMPLQLGYEFGQPMTSHMNTGASPREASDSSFQNDTGWGFDDSTSRMISSFPQYVDSSERRYEAVNTKEWSGAASMSVSSPYIDPYVAHSFSAGDDHSVWQDLLANLRSF